MPVPHMVGRMSVVELIMYQPICINDICACANGNALIFDLLQDIIISIAQIFTENHSRMFERHGCFLSFYYL
jgi:hypothetical protein